MDIQKPDAGAEHNSAHPEYALDPNTLRLRRLKPPHSFIRSIAFVLLGAGLAASGIYASRHFSAPADAIAQALPQIPLGASPQPAKSSVALASNNPDFITNVVRQVGAIW